MIYQIVIVNISTRFSSKKKYHIVWANASVFFNLITKQAYVILFLDIAKVQLFCYFSNKCVDIHGH